MENRKYFFVTGTDTGIGKTYISRLLIDCFSDQLKTTYMKPVQTGCFRDSNGFLRAPDFDFVMEGKAVSRDAYEQHVPYRFEPSCSPHLAAALAGTVISFEYIRNCLLLLSNNNDITIVEGAGGILTPLGDTSFIIDLIKYLDSPVIVVTTPRLGTLNHTFLTLRLLHESGIKVAGIVLNHSSDEPASFIHKDNRRMIETHTHPTPFIEVFFGCSDARLLKEFCNVLVSAWS